MQTAALTTLREGVIRLALATNTLKFGYQPSPIPKIVAKNLYHVHKAIRSIHIILPNIIYRTPNKMSMSSDLHQMTLCSF